MNSSKVKSQESLERLAITYNEWMMRKEFEKHQSSAREILTPLPYKGWHGGDVEVGRKWYDQPLISFRIMRQDDLKSQLLVEQRGKVMMDPGHDARAWPLEYNCMMFHQQQCNIFVSEVKQESIGDKPDTRGRTTCQRCICIAHLGKVAERKLGVEHRELLCRQILLVRAIVELL